MTRQDEMTKFKDNEAMIIVEILGIRNLTRVLRIWSVFLPAITSRSPPIVIQLYHIVPPRPMSACFTSLVQTPVKRLVCDVGVLF